MAIAIGHMGSPRQRERTRSRRRRALAAIAAAGAAATLAIVGWHGRARPCEERLLELDRVWSELVERGEGASVARSLRLPVANRPPNGWRSGPPAVQVTAEGTISVDGRLVGTTAEVKAIGRPMVLEGLEAAVKARADDQVDLAIDGANPWLVVASVGLSALKAMVLTGKTRVWIRFLLAPTADDNMTALPSVELEKPRGLELYESAKHWSARAPFLGCPEFFGVLDEVAHRGHASPVDEMVALRPAAIVALRECRCRLDFGALHDFVRSRIQMGANPPHVVAVEFSTNFHPSLETEPIAFGKDQAWRDVAPSLAARTWKAPPYRLSTTEIEDLHREFVEEARQEAAGER